MGDSGQQWVNDGGQHWLGDTGQPWALSFAPDAFPSRQVLPLGAEEGFGSRPCVPVRCLHPSVAGQGGAGLCWPSSCLGKCLAGCGPAAGPAAGAGATLGTPGRNALRPGSNRFIRFWSRSAGCVRSGEEPPPPSPGSNHFSSPAGKVGSPGGWERVSRWDWGVQDTHCPRGASTSLFPALQIPWG